ncbi:MAG: NADH-quinone oxidoreductase subunit N [Bacteroidales bacterium]|jgi:NADH-quinone oxidoreductase subunit N|nr:NADH-quinone oxidoreductase subunit N [Bacteroidales bacterium]
MSLESFTIMRHELLLTLSFLVILLAEVFTGEERKERVRGLAVIIFGIVTAVGFLPLPEGSIFGDMYRATRTTSLMKNILNIGTLIVFIQSYSWLGRAENRDRIHEYFMLLMTTLIGMNFMISAGHFLMFYIGIELATIPLAALAAYERFKNRSAEAGIKLILSSSLSSGILLFGLSMIYGTTGSLYFSEVAAEVRDMPLVILGFIFFFSGMGFKMSLVPFHLWTADVYEGAPVNVTAYLSVVSKGAAAFIFIIVLFTVFPVIIATWEKTIWIIAVLTITIGNLFALRQKNMKRFLAFSSIAQAGFFLLGFVGGNQLGMTTVIYYALVYIFSNLAAFGIVGIIADKTGRESMDDYDGLYRTNPGLSIAMMLAMFSLAGIPPVAGFFGKFFLFVAAAEKGFYVLVTIAVLNTIIALYYYLLVVKAMFINRNETPIEPFKSDSMSKLGLAICLAGIIVTGFASGIFEMIRNLSYGI